MSHDEGKGSLETNVIGQSSEQSREESVSRELGGWGVCWQRKFL